MHEAQGQGQLVKTLRFRFRFPGPDERESTISGSSFNTICPKIYPTSPPYFHKFDQPFCTCMNAPMEKTADLTTLCRTSILSDGSGKPGYKDVQKYWRPQFLISLSPQWIVSFSRSNSRCLTLIAMKLSTAAITLSALHMHIANGAPQPGGQLRGLGPHANGEVVPYRRITTPATSRLL